MKLSIETANKLMKMNGGWLDLSGTGVTSLPENLTVGGSLDLSVTGVTSSENIRRLRNGDYKDGRYLYADNILTHVKRKLIAGGYTYFEGKIPGRNVIFDGTNFAHCETRQQGLADLRFKAAADRGAEQYKDLPLDHELPLDEMVTMYRVITGACQQGSQAFVDSLGDKLKDRYTIREAVELTRGQYGGNRFAKFFQNRT